MLSVTLQWFVQKLDKGNYHLYLEEGGSKRVGFGEGGKVFVGDARLIVEWQIKKQKDREERIYSSVPVSMSFIDG